MPFSTDGGFDVILLLPRQRHAPEVRGRGPDVDRPAGPGAWPGTTANIANARRGVATGFVQAGPDRPSGAGSRPPHRRHAAGRRAAAGPAARPARRSIPADRHAGPAGRGDQGGDRRQGRAGPRRPSSTFMDDEYLPQGRQEPGRLRPVPTAQRYYAFLVRRHTTTDHDRRPGPRAGPREVARIRAQMEAVKKQAGFKGTLADFSAFLRTDDRLRHQPPAAAGEGQRDRQAGRRPAARPLQDPAAR